MTDYAAFYTFGALLLLALAAGPAAAAPAPVTEVEEVVATCTPPGNGAGPLWCYGAPLLVRRGEVVFASAMETGAGVPRLCNTRWRLFRCGADGWKGVQQAAAFREREPCPIVSPSPDTLLLSANPSTEPPGTEYGPCDPHLVQFSAAHPERPPATVRLRWSGPTHFTDHSYRGIAADGRRGDVLLLNIDADSSAQHWAYRDGSGVFRRAGEIRFPIRACYPQVALRSRAAHVMAVGDIVEPREAWRAYKRERSGSSWDYVFRRLFYTWTPDVDRDGFAAPIEVDSVEATGGHIQNLDLWLDPHGTAHLLYLKTNITSSLRDRFFSGRKISTSLECVALRDGKVVGRRTLVSGGEGFTQTPEYGRFHATPDGTLYLVSCIRTRDGGGHSVLEDRLLQVLPAAKDAKPVRLALREPFTTFFTATERGGSPPSELLDLFGIGREAEMLRYARIRLR